ncbi:hypothetical protein KC343_g8648 [Hortaea werneckii]|uniref:Thioesterase domain-containing protein n=1 Tax=Hortaea werneckii TaxID=91943 RepID=A0A3M7ETY5_HORWE|nr:hypothetical protein KC352_g23750 [Hortaea werneckii]KAI7562432.1 hypothetical protein KC317_g8410 [Hortaea werneckii]KAI7601322.1 hypothetical protein KC346_g12873 [Hortaea werneckii]KAI7619642.1 hypothetical protein KC343_g8648 [Hortaea werneckii]KAI7641369.1 hypothetical protein KC319_g13533 [Hortaea werneckii]
MSAAKGYRPPAGFLDLSPEDRIRMTLTNGGDSHFYSRFLKQCKLESVKSLGPKSTIVTFRCKADPYYSNFSGNLHGGMQSAIFDMLTSIAMQAIGKKDFWVNGGVSRVLNVSYLRPAPEGIELLVECEVVHMGKTLALLQGRMKRADDGAIISTCEHNKVAVPAKPGFKLRGRQFC